MRNYEKLFSHPMYSSLFGYAVSLIFIHALAAVIIPLLLAVVVNGLGKKLRLGVRLLFTLPLAFFGPALVMVAPDYARGLWNIESPQQTYLLIDGIAGLAVACSVGLIVYSAILHGQKETEPGWKPILAPLIITWLIIQLATMAYTIQSFTTLSSLLPNRGGTPLGYFLFQTVRNAQGGLTFSISFTILILVALLGIAATLLVILSKVHLKYESYNETTNPPARGIFTILGWIALVIGGVAALSVTLIPLFMGLFRTLASLGDGASGAFNVSIPRVWINSILPALFLILLIQLPVAYLGALGIGVVRPFGKWSQWSLLLFSPWLFVTSLPLAFAAFDNLRKVQLLDSLFALTPPILLNVPMLFILTLFFRGQELKWQEARTEGISTMRAFFKHLIVPSLPLAALMVAFSLLAATQDLFMPLLVGLSPEQLTATTAILRFSTSTNLASASSVIALFGLPLFLIFFVVFATLQVFYLDRLILAREPGAVEQNKTEMKATNS